MTHEAYVTPRISDYTPLSAEYYPENISVSSALQRFLRHLYFSSLYKCNGTILCVDGLQWSRTQTIEFTSSYGGGVGAGVSGYETNLQCQSPCISTNEHQKYHHCDLYTFWSKLLPWWYSSRDPCISTLPSVTRFWRRVQLRLTPGIWAKDPPGTSAMLDYRKSLKEGILSDPVPSQPHFKL